MKVKLIMTSPVITVHPDEPLEHVNAIFLREKFHHLLVVENNELQGVITDRDLFKAISPNLGKASEKDTDLATLNKKVHQVMARKPISISEDESILNAIRLFDEHGFSCLPVVKANGVPIGIVSWRDIIKMIRTKL